MNIPIYLDESFIGEDKLIRICRKEGIEYDGKGLLIYWHFEFSDLWHFSFYKAMWFFMRYQLFRVLGKLGV